MYAGNKPNDYFDKSGLQKKKLSESDKNSLLFMMEVLMLQVYDDDPIFKGTLIFSAHKDAEKAKEELLDHLSIGNSPNEAEAKVCEEKLFELEEKYIATNVTSIGLSSQVIMTEVNRIGADLVSTGEIPQATPRNQISLTSQKESIIQTSTKRFYTQPKVKTGYSDEPFVGVDIAGQKLYGPFFRTGDQSELMISSNEWWGRGVGNTGAAKTPSVLAYTRNAGPLEAGKSTKFYTPVKPNTGTGKTVAHWPAEKVWGSPIPNEPFPGVRTFSFEGEDWAAIPVTLISVVNYCK